MNSSSCLPPNGGHREEFGFESSMFEPNCCIFSLYDFPFLSYLFYISEKIQILQIQPSTALGLGGKVNHRYRNWKTGKHELL